MDEINSRRAQWGRKERMIHTVPQESVGGSYPNKYVRSNLIPVPTRLDQRDDYGTNQNTDAAVSHT